MSRLEELIAEHCPDGVEYVELGDVCEIMRGKVISKKYIAENTGDYPVYSSQTLNDGVLGYIDSYMLDGDYVSWTTDGAHAGSVFYRSGKFNITNVSGVISIKEKYEGKLHLRFVYYVMSYIGKRYVSAGMGNAKLMSNVVSSIRIPLPPIDVQNEIVRILDTFTELTQELTKELELRQKQYEHYRDTLLTFEDATTNRIGENRS